MIEKGKISAFQMTFLILPPIISTAILTIPNVTGKHAHQDMWISPIWASFNGFLTAFIVYELHKIYPKETIIQYSQRIVGKIIGKVLGFVFLFYFLYVSSLIDREYADFIITSFLPRTPMAVILGSMVLICAFAVRGGLEVVARAAQIFVPVYMLTLVLLILLIPDLQPTNIFPIMEHGIRPSIRGAVQPSLWFGQVFLISMMLPFLIDREKGRKYSMITVGFCMIAMIYINIVSLLLFGESVTTYAYPVFTAFRYISIATFFEHLEVFVIIIWVLGVFIKLSIFYYVLCLGTAQWLRLSDYRPLVFPLGFMIILFGIWVSPSMQEISKFIETIIPFVESSLFTFIPIILLFIAIVQKKRKSKSLSIKD
ncbi:GerAB/ArcD/ProY family transporter [Priestia megaterium]|uniref:GerAB/ArcD/ProY family transporter n=1 Tax=Priestia megaterium TaxID=1404 RepID=UPI00069842A6|nr:endospore germination permease [Priestia megaterium]